MVKLTLSYFLSKTNIDYTSVSDDFENKSLTCVHKGPVASQLCNVTIIYLYIRCTLYSPQKFKRVSCHIKSKFPFWGIYICVDFNLRNQKTKREYEETILNNSSKQKQWYSV